MADRNLLQDLKLWAKEEFDLPAEKLPNDNYLKTLCVGSGKSIWKYIIQHIFHQRKVRNIRGNLQWYKVLQDKEMKETEGQSEAAKRREIQKKVEQLRADITHLDAQIDGTEEQMAARDESSSCVWEQIEEGQLRQLFLQAFMQRCILNRKGLCDDVQQIQSDCQAMEQMTRKAQTELLFDDEFSSYTDTEDIKSKAASVAQVLCELKELSDDRVHFYQSLQAADFNIQQPLSKKMTHEQRTALFKFWLNTAESVLSSHPPGHVLSALQHLASCEQRELQERLSALDVTQEVAALHFRFEKCHLLDVSAEEDPELPPVQTFLQGAWKDVHASLLEVSQTRSRVQKLQKLLDAQKREAEQDISAISDELCSDTQAWSTFEVELQCVIQAAARDHIRHCCLQMDQHAQNRLEALNILRGQWKSILDFRNLVTVRQEQLRGLIKGNSSAKTQLLSLHKQLEDFTDVQLVPQFQDVMAAASNGKNSVSKEAKQFGSVSVGCLDRRSVDGVQRLPVSCLSINRLQSPSLCQSLMFPLYKAPEDLCCRLRSQKLELRFLCELLRLYSTSLQKVEKDTQKLHAPDQRALRCRVSEEDQKLLKALLPRARVLSQRCAQGLSYGSQVKAAITHWWEEPAQHVLPELSKGGLTFQRWLQRWRLASKNS